MARDWKYEAIWHFLYRSTPQSPPGATLLALRTTGDVAKAVETAFQANYQRICNFMLLPAYTGHYFSLAQKVEDLAIFDVHGSLRVPDDGKPYLKEPVASRRNEIFSEMGGLVTLNALMPSFRIIDQVLQQPNAYHMHRSFSALYSGVITGMWTAFEVLCADLWEQSVNVHPKKLSELTGKLSRWKKHRNKKGGDPAKKGDDCKKQEPANDEGTAKSISVVLAQKYNYDLSKVMGTALRGNKSVEFDSIWGIRDAYAIAFNPFFEEVCDALMESSLEHLAALRNVLVHRSGKADDEFVSKMANNQTFNRITVGQDVDLDGEMLVKIIEDTHLQAMALLEAVDKWIRNH